MLARVGEGHRGGSRLLLLRGVARSERAHHLHIPEDVVAVCLVAVGSVDSTPSF